MTRICSLPIQIHPSWGVNVLPGMTGGGTELVILAPRPRPSDGHAIAVMTREPVDIGLAGAERTRTDRGAARMTRRYVDCREIPSDMNCTVGIAADSDDELIEAAVQHAMAVHSHEDTPELRSMIRQTIKDTAAAAV